MYRILIVDNDMLSQEALEAMIAGYEQFEIVDKVTRLSRYAGHAQLILFLWKCSCREYQARKQVGSSASFALIR